MQAHTPASSLAMARVAEADMLVTLRTRQSRGNTLAYVVAMVHAMNLCKKHLPVEHSVVDTLAFAMAMARGTKPGKMRHCRVEQLQQSYLARSWETARATQSYKMKRCLLVSWWAAVPDMETAPGTNVAKMKCSLWEELQKATVQALPMHEGKHHETTV